MAKKRIRVVETTVTVYQTDEVDLENIDTEDDEQVYNFVEEHLIHNDAAVEEYSVVDREVRALTNPKADVDD